MSQLPPDPDSLEFEQVVPSVGVNEISTAGAGGVTSSEPPPPPPPSPTVMVKDPVLVADKLAFAYQE